MLNSLRKNIIRYGGRILIAAPILLAAILVAYFMSRRDEPAREAEPELERILRVIQVPKVDAVPTASGYGIVEAERIWEAVAEVPGTITYIHPRLSSGELIERGEVLIELDKQVYNLMVGGLEAGVEEIEGKLEELDESERYTERLLAKEKRALELARNAYDRKSHLFETNVISLDQKEREEQNYLQQKRSVTQLEEKLALIPARRRQLQAHLDSRGKELEQAGIDLDKTTIKAPFDGRLGEIKIAPGQFVGAGRSLFEFSSIDRVEIEARFRAEQLRPLVIGNKDQKISTDLSTDKSRSFFADINVWITLSSGDWVTHWEGEMNRIRGEWDSKTRDLKVVLTVDRPYEEAILRQHPLLLPGAFCQVRLSGVPRSGRLVLPREALHDNDTVFVLDRDNRLRKRLVTVELMQPKYVVIESGLTEGETVIVSDPSPAIEGMKVSPVKDDEVKQRLLAESRGDDKQ